MTSHYAICILLMVLVPLATCSDKEDHTRDERLISTFQVVRFPNDGCVASTTRNGTCYTSQECSNLGGTSSGSCADGFGVCCVFVVNTCGSSSSQNMTAWTAPTTVNSGVCDLMVIPSSDDICSLRLDFTSFVITGPSTVSIAQGRRRFGQPDEMNADANYALEGVSFTTNCHTDQFYTQGPSPSTNPPVICGTNTGQHLYVEADIDRGNRLMFVFSDMFTIQGAITRGASALATRAWDITISHIECSSATLPPTGCTKYYWNAAGTARLINYNFQDTVAFNNMHLAQQHERFCIRRERAKCVGCFTAAEEDFQVAVNNEGIAAHYSVTGGCCGYYTHIAINAPETTDDSADQNGLSNAVGGQFGWDCVIIPGAFFPTTADEGDVQITQTVLLAQTRIDTTAGANVPMGPHICGGNMGIGPGKGILSQGSSLAALAVIAMNGLATAETVCTRNVPFILEFMSDDLEGIGVVAIDSEFGIANGGASQGFKIEAFQLDC